MKKWVTRIKILHFSCSYICSIPKHKQTKKIGANMRKIETVFPSIVNLLTSSSIISHSPFEKPNEQKKEKANQKEFKHVNLSVS
jgi:hypothetical protein